MIVESRADHFHCDILCFSTLEVDETWEVGRSNGDSVRSQTVQEDGQFLLVRELILGRGQVDLKLLQPYRPADCEVVDIQCRQVVRLQLVKSGNSRVWKLIIRSRRDM